MEIARGRSAWSEVGGSRRSAWSMVSRELFALKSSSRPSARVDAWTATFFGLLAGGGGRQNSAGGRREAARTLSSAVAFQRERERGLGIFLDGELILFGEGSRPPETRNPQRQRMPNAATSRSIGSSVPDRCEETLEKSGEGEQSVGDSREMERCAPRKPANAPGLSRGKTANDEIGRAHV